MRNLFKSTALVAVCIFMCGVFSSAVPDCPPPGPVGFPVMLPNPADCRSFYMCEDGEPILQQCPEGLLFDDELDSCTWPQDTDCNDDGPIYTRYDTEVTYKTVVRKKYDDKGREIEVTTHTEKCCTPGESFFLCTHAPC